MNRVRSGVSSRAKRALTCAAVAGAAGMLGGVAHAADDVKMAPGEVVATAPGDDDQPHRRGEERRHTVEGVDIEGRRVIRDVKQTATPLENPQTVTVVSRGVIEAQNLLSLRDILSTVPGITFGAGEGGGGYGDSINLRGYSANNDITVDGVRDSAQYTRSDPFNLEQVEVTNGANSVYTGAGSVGGNINIVSKRPGPRDSTTVTGAVGTESYFRGTIDSNMRVNESVAVRVNLLAHKNDVPGRDVEKAERWGIAPSITIGLHSPTRFTALYLHQEDDNIPQYGVPFFNGARVPGVPTDKYYGYSNLDRQKQKVDMLTGIIDHDFGDGLSIRNLSRYQKVTQDAVVSATQGVFCLPNGQKPVGWGQTSTATNISGYAACLATDPAPGFYQPSGPRGSVRDTENTLLYNQTDLSWNFNTGSASHKLVAGVAFLSEDFYLDAGNLLRTANGTAVVLPTMNIANPNNVYAGPINYIRSSIQEGQRQNQAVYLFDNIEFNPQVSLNFGLRYEHNEGENRTDAYSTVVGPTLGVLTPGPTFRSDENLFTWRAGLVYKPVPNASLYVSIANSQTPSQATVNGSGACSATTCNVKPEKARNYEIGGKWDVGGQVSLTAALFRNDRTNYRVPSADPLIPDAQLDGKARVEGLALGASGRITDVWSVFANYTYLKSEVLQGVAALAAAAGQDFTKGDDLVSVPDHAFSLYTSYDLPNHVQVGYGVTYSGEMYISQHGSITGTTPLQRTTIPLAKVDSFWVHRATVAWAPTRAWEIRLNVNNLFNELYFQRARNNGWATPGERRNARVSVSYRF